MAEKIEQPETATKQQQIDGNITSLTVEELYDKDKYDLSTMELEDVTSLLQYVIEFSHNNIQKVILIIDLLSL